MGVLSDDEAVSIQKGKKPSEPYTITINCPDKTGLGCDICRIVLDFGLCITKGDFSTDGRWCYIVLWVVPHSSTPIVRWPNLMNRLQSVCPTCTTSFYLNQPSPRAAASSVFMLTFCCLDRKGLLHDVTRVLCELEVTIQRVKVMTTPDDRVLDIFLIIDNLELLHTKKRQEEITKRLHSVLADTCISCELQLAGSEYDYHQGSSLSPAVADELLGSRISDKEGYILSKDMTQLRKASVTVDNSLSPAHTLLQIQCLDHKGLLYNIMRTLKDNNIQISYGRLDPVAKGNRGLDLFIRQNDGKKIVDPLKQSSLCSRLKMEMLHPLRVIVTNRGPDTELLVANPVELSGIGRPRVFYEVTLALKILGICIFSADIARQSTEDREWEVYRFLLEEDFNLKLTDSVRNQIVDRVRRTLMGWGYYNSILMEHERHSQSKSRMV